jgi:thimet oligopeptidase
MVGTPQKAEEFLLEMVNAYEPIREKESEVLLEMKRKDVGGCDGDDVVLDSWDVVYYSRMYMAEYARVDEAALKLYFPLEHVKCTILDIYEELLGLKFERVLDAQAWHDDVECYAVHDDDNGGDVLGHFYLDIFPRKGKYSHQCVYPLSPSYTAGKGTRILPACVNIGNLTPSREGSPSLLLSPVREG